jgi:hypothetical protein
MIRRFLFLVVLGLVAQGWYLQPQADAHQEEEEALSMVEQSARRWQVPP